MFGGADQLLFVIVLGSMTPLFMSLQNYKWISIMTEKWEFCYGVFDNRQLIFQVNGGIIDQITRTKLSTIHVTLSTITILNILNKP